MIHILKSRKLKLRLRKKSPQTAKLKLLTHTSFYFLNNKKIKASKTFRNKVRRLKMRMSYFEKKDFSVLLCFVLCLEDKIQK